jgi:hypothetical protein
MPEQHAADKAPGEHASDQDQLDTKQEDRHQHEGNDQQADENQHGPLEASRRPVAIGQTSAAQGIGSGVSPPRPRALHPAREPTSAHVPLDTVWGGHASLTG